MIQETIQISARGFTLSDWWKAKILRKVEKMTEFNNRITHCRIVVEVPHKHNQKGCSYVVHIDIELPHGVVIIDREPALTLNEAIDRAFDAAERKIRDQTRIIRHMVKYHEAARPN